MHQKTPKNTAKNKGECMLTRRQFLKRMATGITGLTVRFSAFSPLLSDNLLKQNPDFSPTQLSFATLRKVEQLINSNRVPGVWYLNKEVLSADRLQFMEIVCRETCHYITSFSFAKVEGGCNLLQALGGLAFPEVWDSVPSGIKTTSYTWVGYNWKIIGSTISLLKKEREKVKKEAVEIFSAHGLSGLIMTDFPKSLEFTERVLRRIEIKKCEDEQLRKTVDKILRKLKECGPTDPKKAALYASFDTKPAGIIIPLVVELAGNLPSFIKYTGKHLETTLIGYTTAPTAFGSNSLSDFEKNVQRGLIKIYEVLDPRIPYLTENNPEDAWTLLVIFSPERIFILSEGWALPKNIGLQMVPLSRAANLVVQEIPLPKDIKHLIRDRGSFSSIAFLSDSEKGDVAAFCLAPEKRSYGIAGLIKPKEIRVNQQDFLLLTMDYGKIWIAD